MPPGNVLPVAACRMEGRHHRHEMPERIVLEIDLPAEEVGDLLKPVARLRAVVAVIDRPAVGVGHAQELIQPAGGLPLVTLHVAIAVGDVLQAAGRGDRRIETEEMRHRPVRRLERELVARAATRAVEFGAGVVAGRRRVDPRAGLQEQLQRVLAAGHLHVAPGQQLQVQALRKVEALADNPVHAVAGQVIEAETPVHIPHRADGEQAPPEREHARAEEHRRGTAGNWDHVRRLAGRLPQGGGRLPRGTAARVRAHRTRGGNRRLASRRGGTRVGWQWAWHRRRIRIWPVVITAHLTLPK